MIEIKKPNFSFCGYPVRTTAGSVQRDGDWWIPCGNIATPGCAYCDEHAGALIDYENDRDFNDVPTMAEAKRDSFLARFVERAMVRTAIAAVVPISADLFPVVAHWLYQYGWWVFAVYVCSIIEAMASTIHEVFGRGE